MVLFTGKIWLPSIHFTMITSTIGVAIPLLFITLVLYNFARCPLHALPGPWHSRFTGLVLKYNTVIGRRIHYVHSLHQRHGSIIRIAPFEVDVLDIESFKVIHKISGGFWKSSWYRMTRNQPVHELFTMQDPKHYGPRRRLLARPFSNSSLTENWEALVRERTIQAVSRIKRDAEAGDVDIFKWWTRLAYDIITTLAFGENPHLIEAENLNEEVHELELGLKIGAMRSEVKLLFDAIFCLPVPYLRNLYHIFDRIRAIGMKAAENRTSINKSNVFSNMVNEVEKGEGMTDVDVAVEATSLMTAGSETTSITMTYLVWIVLQLPDVKAALQEEFMSLPADFTNADMEKLPILGAVINETLRLYGAAPGSLPRVVPPGGAKLGSYYLKEGLTVSTQAFSYHRDPTIFPDPEKFDYTRWLPGAVNHENFQAAFHPFGAGARACSGIHLARMELRYATVIFFRECWKAKLSKTTTPESMAMANYFVIRPAAEKCEITMT